jgi:hypothetical protein
MRSVSCSVGHHDDCRYSEAEFYACGCRCHLEPVVPAIFDWGPLSVFGLTDEDLKDAAKDMLLTADSFTPLGVYKQPPILWDYP